MAGSITDLVIFGVIFSVVLVILFLIKTFVFKGRISSNWAPGQHMEIKLPSQQDLLARPRQKYIDPLGKLNPVFVSAGIATVMALVFVIYFVMKGSMLMGN